MNRACVAFLPLLGLALFGCGSSSSQRPDAGTPDGGGLGGAGPTGGGGNTGGGSTPVFTRADCGTIAVSDAKPGTTAAAPGTFATGQLVGGRVDPDSVSNQEHYWTIQLAPGFYHLVLDGRTADGTSTNIGLKVTGLPTTDDNSTIFGNEVARYYRDQAFFEIKTSMLVTLKVISNFKMADYVMGVFANGAAVPSPLFSHCPTVTPLTLGTPAAFMLGADGTATAEKWFLVDLDLANYQFMLDATQADGADTNLIYSVDALDRFGKESRAMQIVFENKVGPHFAAQGTLSVGEMAPYWIRVRNAEKALNMTMTVNAQ